MISRVDLFGTCLRAIEDGVTAPDSRPFAVEHGAALFVALVARVEDITEGFHQRGGAEILLVGPEAGAARGATAALDAARGFLDAAGMGVVQ